MRRRTALLAAGGVAAIAGAAQARRRLHPASQPARPAAIPGGRETTVAASDGASLAVTEAGSGPLVVFAHGWTESQSIWTDVATDLCSTGYRVVAYDQRGHGGSTIGTAGISIERLGQDLHDVLAAFGARDATVVGHSMGGMTVMALLGARPDLTTSEVGAAVLVSTAAASLGRNPRIDATVGRMIGSSVVTRAFGGPAGPRLVRGSLGRSPQRAHMAATASLFAGTAGSTRRDCFVAMSAMDLRAGLAAIDCPVTVVVGERDRLTPPRQAREIAHLIKGAELVIIPGAGHQLPFEAPGRLAALIRAAVTAGAGEELVGLQSGSVA